MCFPKRLRVTAVWGFGLRSTCSQSTQLSWGLMFVVSGCDEEVCNDDTCSWRCLLVKWGRGFIFHLKRLFCRKTRITTTAESFAYYINIHCYLSVLKLSASLLHVVLRAWSAPPACVPSPPRPSGLQLSSPDVHRWTSRGGKMTVVCWQMARFPFSRHSAALQSCHLCRLVCVSVCVCVLVSN